MAIIYPPIEEIMNMRVQATDGEFYLLSFLNEYLDDTYEVFFQPFLDGDIPDIVIIKENVGVWIIEVKDWKLNNYRLEDKSWFLKKNGAKILSPFSQVNKYRKGFFTIHSTYLEKILKENSKGWLMVKTSIYFHNSTKDEINEVISEDLRKYTDCLGRDSLNANDFTELLSIKHMDRNSHYFTKEVYSAFQTILKPSNQFLEMNERPELSKKQLELAFSEPGLFKIKGPAGSGKSLVLAKRAVNAAERTNEKVLILTFNITLKNYISDQITKFRGDLHRSTFEITNYKRFIVGQLQKYDVYFGEKINWRDVELFSLVESEIMKYDVILCDEAQDFDFEWLQILLRYFLKADGEFVVFIDEMQKIYKRKLRWNDILKIMPGPWKKLNGLYRLSPKILDFSIRYQNKFMKNMYDILKETPKYRVNHESNSKIIYYYSSQTELNESEVKVMTEKLNDMKINLNDICILSTNSRNSLVIDLYLRKTLGINTNTIFIDEHSVKTGEIIEQKDIKVLSSKSKKHNFYMNSGTIKISTIHSFKGWEIDTLILVVSKFGTYQLDDQGKKFVVNNELLYSAITRCKRNLILINLGNHEFDNFVSEIDDLIDEKHVISKIND